MMDGVDSSVLQGVGFGTPMPSNRSQFKFPRRNGAAGSTASEKTTRKVANAMQALLQSM